jgi:hypothetical protein
MFHFPRTTIFFVAAFALIILVLNSTAAQQQLPNPVLAFIGQEPVEVGGKQVIRYKYEVANRTKYPNELFAPAPNLPPCGSNTKSARTWIDVYDQRGKRLNGFCKYTKSHDLDKLWFELAPDIVPPSWVYIEMTDRQTNTKYKSNLAETTL